MKTNRLIRLAKPGSLILGSLLIASGLLAGTSLLSAQTPPHDGLAACQRYATDYYRQNNPENFESISLSAQDLNEEKYEGKVGRQFVSTVLSGQGTLRFKGEDPTPVQFTCLLKNDQKAVFVHMRQGEKADAAKTCWNSFMPGNWGNLQTCMKKALTHEEAQLQDLQTQAGNWAQKVDSRWHNVNAKQKMAESDADWQTYRDQECARRDAFRAGGNHPDVSRLECLLRKTQERIKDFRWDEPESTPNDDTQNKPQTEPKSAAK